MKYFTLICAMTFALGLSGCGFLFGEEGYFRDRGDDYLKSGSIPPMELPPGTDQDAVGQLYVVPDVNKANYEYPDGFEVPRPEALSSNVYSESVKIQKLGDDRWIFINASPAEVWPRVRNFLNANGLQVARTDAPGGLIETAWLNFRDDPDTRDKYLLRIEQGIQPDSSEIHVTHLSVPRDSELPSQVNWPGQSSSAEREAWMVDELAANLAAEIGSGSASLLAQTIGGDPKISIVATNREPVLRMELRMVRAWASLSHALEQEGLEIIDQDATAEIFYVHYSDPEESEGFFSGWFSRDDTPAKYSLKDVLDHLEVVDTPENRELFPPEAFAGSEGQLDEDVAGYLVIARETDGAVEVVIRDPHGQPLEPRTTRDLLGIIRRNLI